MSESNKTVKANWPVRASFGLGLLTGLGIATAVVSMDPSCNPTELESQPLGKPSPPLPPPEL